MNEVVISATINIYTLSAKQQIVLDEQLVQQLSGHRNLACGVQISFGKILTPLGVGLLAYGFGSYFQLLPGTSAAAIVLIYGFPLTLLGFALSYAQLEPVPCLTTEKAMSLRQSQMTDIQKQVAPWTFQTGACGLGTANLSQCQAIAPQSHSWICWPGIDDHRTWLITHLAVLRAARHKARCFAQVCLLV